MDVHQKAFLVQELKGWLAAFAAVSLFLATCVAFPTYVGIESESVVLTVLAIIFGFLGFVGTFRAISRL